MVFNVTKSYIKTRMMVAAEDIWPPESAKDAQDRDAVASFSGRGWKTDRDGRLALREGQLSFDAVARDVWRRVARGARHASGRARGRTDPTTCRRPPSLLVAAVVPR